MQHTTHSTKKKKNTHTHTETKTNTRADKPLNIYFSIWKYIYQGINTCFSNERKTTKVRQAKNAKQRTKKKHTHTIQYVGRSCWGTLLKGLWYTWYRLVSAPCSQPIVGINGAQECEVPDTPFFLTAGHCTTPSFKTEYKVPENGLPNHFTTPSQKDNTHFVFNIDVQTSIYVGLEWYQIRLLITP